MSYASWRRLSLENNVNGKRPERPMSVLQAECVGKRRRTPDPENCEVDADGEPKGRSMLAALPGRRNSPCPPHLAGALSKRPKAHGGWASRQAALQSRLSTSWDRAGAATSLRHPAPARNAACSGPWPGRFRYFALPAPQSVAIAAQHLAGSAPAQASPGPRGVCDRETLWADAGGQGRLAAGMLWLGEHVRGHPHYWDLLSARVRAAASA